MTIKDYVEGIFADVPDSLEKDNIKQEIILNLEEKVQDLVDSGKAEEDAINKSIVDFGDAQEIKNDLMQASGIKTAPVKKKTNYVNNLWFSIWGSALIIGLFFFINYTTAQGVFPSPSLGHAGGYPWFIYPTFAVLWWPLSMFFVWLNNRKK